MPDALNKKMGRLMATTDPTGENTEHGNFRPTRPVRVDSFDRAAVPSISDFLEGRGLVLTGPRSSKWRTTRCEFHSGSDSLRVNTSTSGWCCMSCGAHGGDSLSYLMQIDGLDFQTAARQLGCWRDDGQPHRVYKPAGLRPVDALAVLATESLIVAMVASDAAKGKPVSEVDAGRALAAAGRIQHIAREVSHG